MSKGMANKIELIGWAYVRVSTVDQSNVLHGSIEQQLNRIKRWQGEQTQRTGVKHTVERFIDEDISGRAQSLHKRREYHELIRAIERREIDFVVVEKLDRLHRDLVESRKFIDLCDAMGIKFYRLDGGLVDLKDRSSRTSVFIESWIAEEYSLDLVEKLTKKGREARVNNGKDNNSLPVLGMDEHPTEACFYVINPEEQKIVKDIFNYFCSCGDLQQTVKYCEQNDYRTKVRRTREKVEKGKKIPPKLVGGIPFDSKNLRALLVNRKIAGFGYFKDDWKQFPSLQDANGMVRFDFRHGAVINPKLFEKAQELLRKNAKFNHRIYKDQRVYFLSGILFDTDGNKFRGESAKTKSNFYYMNPNKKYRIRADGIEKAVVNHLGSLLKENGILKEAVAQVFTGENTVLKQIDHEIAQKVKESMQCERLLEVMSKQGRAKILENPDLLDEILLEGIKVKKESEAQLKKLQHEITVMHHKKEELSRFSNKEDICMGIQRALKALKKSSSLHKKQLIQAMVPKLVIDEKNDQLCFFINPFLEKSFKNNELSLKGTRPILTLNSKNSGQGEIVDVAENQVGRDLNLSQSKKKVRVAEEWRGSAKLCKLFFIQPVYQGFTPYYVVPLYKNKIFIQHKYVVEGLSAKQIAQEILCSKMAVLNALDRFDIQVREPHHHHGRPSQPRYGQKYYKHKLVGHQTEQRVIHVVKELRDKNLSLREIAMVLNEMKIATKGKGRRWHQEMVRRILSNIDSTAN